MSLFPTPSQTVGPYFALGLDPLNKHQLNGPGIAGSALVIGGVVTDGAGAPVPDAVLEIWQANSAGRYAHPEDTRELVLEPGWHGFGRIPTDAAGRFAFTTVKPGPVPGPGSTEQAPHIVVLIGMRGLLRHLLTRIYFPGEPSNATDPILGRVPVERRETLVARPAGDGALEWNIVLQGPHETVFFSY